MGDIEERIRDKAHELWLEDGMPEGRQADHWFKASEIVRREIFEETVPQPNPATESEVYAGIVNPDPAARQSDEPVEQRAAEDRDMAKGAKFTTARARKGVPGESQTAPRGAPTQRADTSVPAHGLLS